MTKRFLVPLLAATALSLSACGQTAEEAPAVDTTVAEEAAPAGTIVDVASGNADFSTLVAAVQAAKLAETLSSAGPFTVFAPTNAAFAALPEGMVDKLTTTEREKLASILTYHVVAGEVMSPALIEAITAAGEAGHAITTVNGAVLTAKLVDGKVMLTDAGGNSATVTATDVDASNGVVHVIDKVLMPA
jgi:uncharacterized surface protein with fasciclin (FAS1) repeats